MGNETDEQFLSGETEEEEKERLKEERKEDIEEDSNDGYPINLPTPKHNVHTFLNNIQVTKIISEIKRIGNLKEEELGMPFETVRGDFECALIAEDICEEKFFTDHFNKNARDTILTSLSRNGFFPKLGIVQKRIIEDETKPRKENKGWFAKKKPEETEQ